MLLIVLSVFMLNREFAFPGYYAAADVGGVLGDLGRVQ